VPFVPRRRLSLVQHSPAPSRDARRCLQRTLPDSWRFAQRAARDLACQIEHLAWAARVEILDVWFLRQAETMLQLAGVSRLISGEQVPAGASSAAALEGDAARFGIWSRAVVSAVLAELAEPPTVSNPHQALTLLLTGELRLARPAAHWAAEHGVTPVRQTLNELPGYALVLLAASPNDTAERVMARDAFWAAVMERS
jgi:hypothetical protein